MTAILAETPVDFQDLVASNAFESPCFQSKPLTKDRGRTRTSSNPPNRVAYAGVACRKGSPRRPLDWRWQRAQELMATGQGINPHRDDLQVKEILDWLRLRSWNPRATETSYRALTWAQRIRAEAGRREALLRAWLLTGISVSDVAAEVGIDAEICEAYHGTYFDVQDRRSYRDWVVSHVLQLHTRHFASFEEAEFTMWQLDALDGPQVLKNLLELSRLSRYGQLSPEEEMDDQIMRIWKYRMGVLLIANPHGSQGSHRALQRLHFEQREHELARERLRMRHHRNWEENRQTRSSCSTREGHHGFGETAGHIETLLLSLGSGG